MFFVKLMVPTCIFENKPSQMLCIIIAIARNGILFLEISDSVSGWEDAARLTGKLERDG